MAKIKKMEQKSKYPSLKELQKMSADKCYTQCWNMMREDLSQFVLKIADKRLKEYSKPIYDFIREQFKFEPRDQQYPGITTYDEAKKYILLYVENQDKIAEYSKMLDNQISILQQIEDYINKDLLTALKSQQQIYITRNSLLIFSEKDDFPELKQYEKLSSEYIRFIEQLQALYKRGSDTKEILKILDKIREYEVEIDTIKSKLESLYQQDMQKLKKKEVQQNVLEKILKIQHHLKKEDRALYQQTIDNIGVVTAKGELQTLYRNIKILYLKYPERKKQEKV